MSHSTSNSGEVVVIFKSSNLSEIDDNFSENDGTILSELLHELIEVLKALSESINGIYDIASSSLAMTHEVRNDTHSVGGLDDAVFVGLASAVCNRHYLLSEVVSNLSGRCMADFTIRVLFDHLEPFEEREEQIVVHVDCDGLSSASGGAEGNQGQNQQNFHRFWIIIIAPETYAIFLAPSFFSFSYPIINKMTTRVAFENSNEVGVFAKLTNAYCITAVGSS